MPMFKVSTTFIDGRRDSFTREAAHGFAAVDDALAKYGTTVQSVAAIHVREEGFNPRSLPVVTIEGYIGPSAYKAVAGPPWRCAGCMRSVSAWLVRCDGCGSMERL